jgi:hypothetical protein
MGLFKGMLHKKKITAGLPIQLVSSMKKVGPSLESMYHDQAVLMITKHGFNKTNQYVHRLINKGAKAPPKLFKIKPLCDMILHHLKGLGVPNEVCKQYKLRGQGHRGLNQQDKFSFLVRRTKIC